MTDELIRKRLLTGTLPANNSLLTGTVPANNLLFTGTVPANILNVLTVGLLSNSSLSQKARSRGIDWLRMEVKATRSRVNLTSFPYIRCNILQYITWPIIFQFCRGIISCVIGNNEP